MRYSKDRKVPAARWSLGTDIVATEKTVVVNVADSDLQVLKGSGYRLCFSKPGNGDIYDVIWQAYEEFLSTNVFGWDSVYEIFCTNSFEEGDVVRSTTNFVEIEFGQQCTLGEDGLLSSPSSGGNESTINLINQYGSIFPGLGQFSVGIDNATSMAPIFVSETEIIIGDYELVTTDEVMVWFEQDVESGAMFTKEISNSYVADLTTYDEVTLLYEDGVWSLVGSE